MGKWIELETDASTGKPYLWKCDECGEEVTTRWNYCPECGDPKTSKGKSINTLVKALETEHRKLREMQSATDKNVGTTDARQDFMDIVYSELADDPDNNRANRIIWAADGYAERRVDDALQVIEELQSVQLGTNLAEVGTDCISRQAAIDALRTCYDTETVTMDNGDEYINYGDAVGEIEQLPPIQSKLLQPWEVLVAQAVLPQPEQHIDADGTLWVTVTDIEQVTRVIVDEEKSKFCRQFYMEEEQRTGHWIPVGIAEAVGGETAQWGSAIAYHKCSECDGQALGDDFEQEVLSKWCPHCGAKMEGDAE